MSKKKSPSGKSNKPGPFASLSHEGTGRRGRAKKGPRGLKLLIVLFCLCIVAGLLAVLGGAIYFNVKALSFDMDDVREVPQRTLVYDRSGNELGHVSGHGENRRVVPASEVSEHFINALLAREDSRFYEHDGVDYRGVARAIVRNLKAADMEQGASTLTMQLARNTYGMREISIKRKLLEVAIAKRIERNFSKEEILGFYMNRVYFGFGLYGIERASQGFFMKPASELGLGESAMLAGIIRGPSLLNPFRSIENAEATRDEALARLVADDRITPEEATAAKAEPIVLRPPGERMATGSYTLQAVYELLNDYITDEDQIKIGGLEIYTTIDSTLQEAAEKALDDHLTGIEKGSGFAHPPRSAHQPGEATKYLQGAVVSLDNATGEILAMVGGRDFAESSFNRAYEAQRQVGSTFKPFVYSVAFDRSGLLPGSNISDDPVRIEIEGSRPWTPKNSDGTFTGVQPAAIGLIRSRNTMSVRVGQRAGLQTVRSLAEALKFGETPNSPVVFLGGFETTPMTITSAYSTFASKGINQTPHLIRKIVNTYGEVIYETKIGGPRIFPESVSWMTSDILGKVMDEGTGAGARRAGYGAPAYGKTGTTNDYHDAWFVGYTDKVTTGVWVGLDRPKPIMDRGYGSTLALPVWTEVMKTAESNGYAAEKIPPPPGTAPTLLCRVCDGVASNQTPNPYQMDLPADLRPRHTCRGHRPGFFTNRDELSEGRPVPREERPGARPAEGVGKALRGIGRFIFGGGR
ncbi:MAG: PBP1A family penicillin-binding protein [Verrucomicrobiales bacterium]